MANFLRGLAQIAGAAGQAVQGYGIDRQNAIKQALLAKQEAREAENDRIRNALLTKQTSLVGLPQPKGTIIVPRGARAIDEASGNVVAEGLPPVEQTELVTGKGGKVMKYNKDTNTYVDTGIIKDTPVDPFAKMAEAYREEHDRREADNWQRIYAGLLEPKHDKYGDVVEGTGLSPAEASRKADAAMGGHPRLAPKIDLTPPATATPPALGRTYTPARP